MLKVDAIEELIKECKMFTLGSRLYFLTEKAYEADEQLQVIKRSAIDSDSSIIDKKLKELGPAFRGFWKSTFVGSKGYDTPEEAFDEAINNLAKNFLEKECPDCWGDGITIEVGDLGASEACKRCNGTGKINEKSC